MFSSRRNAKNQHFRLVFVHPGLATIYSHCLALLSTCSPWLEAAALLRLTFTLQLEENANVKTLFLLGTEIIN
jgi:hypothetical protein